MSHTVLFRRLETGPVVAEIVEIDAVDDRADTDLRRLGVADLV